MKALEIALAGLGLMALPLCSQDAASGSALENARRLQEQMGGGAKQDELPKKLREAYTAAADWLVKMQQEAGDWKAGPPDKQQTSLSYTGLVTAALAGAPEDLRGNYKAAIDKAAAFIASKQNSDGSFGEGPTGGFLKTYATGLCMMALGSADFKKYQDALGNARGYLKNNQLKEGPDRGGLGYGDLDPKPTGMVKMEANLSTLGFGAEGMKAANLPADDAFWKLCVEYVKKCQNNSELNTDKEFLARLKEKGLSVGDDGGLYYSANPDKQQTERVKLGDKEVITSYGSMTYDGIKTYLYAGLANDSKEVKAAMDWVRKNYVIDAHPGFPTDEKKRTELQGLYYYYLMMVRALDAYGERPLQTMDGKKHDWAREVGEKLLALRKEGKWVNENPRWWENDPVLVTMYVLNTLNVVCKHVK